VRARTLAGAPPWARGFAGDRPWWQRPAEAPRAGTDLARPGRRAKMMPRPGGVLRSSQVLKESGGAARDLVPWRACWRGLDRWETPHPAV